MNKNTICNPLQSKFPPRLRYIKNIYSFYYTIKCYSVSMRMLSYFIIRFFSFKGFKRKGATKKGAWEGLPMLKSIYYKRGSITTFIVTEFYFIDVTAQLNHSYDFVNNFRHFLISLLILQYNVEHFGQQCFRHQLQLQFAAKIFPEYLLPQRCREFSFPCFHLFQYILLHS